jgi:hypothetical protein
VASTVQSYVLEEDAGTGRKVKASRDTNADRDAVGA